MHSERLGGKWQRLTKVELVCLPNDSINAAVAILLLAIYGKRYESWAACERTSTELRMSHQHIFRGKENKKIFETPKNCIIFWLFKPKSVAVNLRRGKTTNTKMKDARKRSRWKTKHYTTIHPSSILWSFKTWTRLKYAMAPSMVSISILRGCARFLNTEFTHTHSALTHTHTYFMRWTRASSKKASELRVWRNVEW